MIMGICRKIKWNNPRTIRNGTNVGQKARPKAIATNKRKAKSTEAKDEAIKHSVLFSNQKLFGV